MSVRSSRVSASVLGLPLLRVHRIGDLHTVREVFVDVTVDFSDIESALDEARLRTAVQALAQAALTQEPEQLAGTIARHIAERIVDAARVQVDVAFQRWTRLEIGGRPRTSDFARHESDRRTAHVTIEGGTVTVHAGIGGMQLLSAQSEAGTPLLVRLDARWTYGWADVPFDTQWQQVKRALVEAYTERRVLPGPGLAHALGCAVLDESPPVRSIELRLSVNTFEPLDIARFGMDPTPELVSAPTPGTAVYVAAVERAEMQELR